MEWIVEAPTLKDVVTGKRASFKHLVRCKDCKHFHYSKPFFIGESGVPVMGNLVYDKWADGCRTDPDGFCFMGERKDDE